MARLDTGDLSLVQYVEKKLCEILGVEYERSMRKCVFRFEMPTGAVTENEVEREVLPAPVHEIMEEFLEKALTQQYDDGYKVGKAEGYSSGYDDGYSDGKEGNERQEPEPPKEGYSEMPIRSR